MKLSAVNVTLSKSDIMTLIRDYLDVEGLNIKDININEFIEIEGSYKRGKEFSFKAKLALGSVNQNILNVRILKINLLGFKIISAIKNTALKAVTKKFKEYGLKSNKDNVKVDLDILSKKIPYVYFKINGIEVLKNSIKVSVDNFVYSKDIKEEKVKDTKTKTKKSNFLKPKKDAYSNIRFDINKKVPNKYKPVFEFAMVVPDITVLLYRLFRNPRVDRKMKVLIGSILTYVVSPIDIIPSFIPVLGEIDDLAVLFFGLNKVIEEVPKDIILSNWQGKDNIFELVKKGIEFISNKLGGKNIEKIINMVLNIVNDYNEGSSKPHSNKSYKNNKNSNHINAVSQK